MQAFAMTWAKRSVLVTVAFAQTMPDGKLRSNKDPQVQDKVFNDPIHGHVKLHPPLVKIINTPEFDRLQHLRQLGEANYVFPGACHNRFEHSSGVAHLAEKLARALKTKQPELDITDRDILCVEIAGRCHDLDTTRESFRMPMRLSLELPPGFEKWDKESMCQYLQHMQDKFREKGITGAKLQKLTDDEQRKLGIRIHFEEEGKVFNDPIHGNVELHPLLVKIIDTPQFQRLRHIKQLGGGYFVYPGACHNRFEHSIGVAHLAGQFAQALKSKQPELNITDRDVLCVQIAGLCHDLGHGPFSHLFDGMFIPKVRDEAHKDKKWEHEENSTRMFDHMVEKNDLKKAMKHYGLEPELDITFIKEMIGGHQKTATGEKRPYEGRRQDKSFLYEIVANKINGVDVDKFDYFARDCHHLGIQHDFDHRRFIQFARVCEVDGEKHICIRDKEKDNLRDLFENRTTLHRKACQHRVKTLIETMITDAFVKADKFIKIKGMEPNGEEKTFTLSKAIDNMDAYTKLTDRVFDLILIEPSQMYISGSENDDSITRDENNSDMDAAREILKRIITRDFYLCLGKFELPEPLEEVKNQWKKDLAGPSTEGLTADDFEIVVTSLDYRMKGEDGKKVDPISNVYFYSKFAPTEGFKNKQDEQMSKVLEERFSKVLISVYLKNNEKYLAAKKHFEQWSATLSEDQHPERAVDVA